MVTALADGPADGAMGSGNDGNGNTQSDGRQKDERIQDTVQTPKTITEHGMNNSRTLLNVAFYFIFFFFYNIN